MNLLGQPAYVGRFCGSNLYTVTAKEVAFYADALDDHHPLHEQVAPPLIFHSECYKHLGEWYLKNLFGNLHAQQDWEMYAAIPIDVPLRTQSTIIDRFDKRGRNYVVNETNVLVAETGQLLVRGRTYQSFLPPERTGDDSTELVVDEATPKSKPERAPFPTATGADLADFGKTVDERRCWMFSGPAKNYHTDREQARKLGFPNIVVQGMMSTCFVSQLMQESFGMGWVVGGRMSLKLTNVLWVDESVKVFGRVLGEIEEGSQRRVECEVWADKLDGTRIALGTASAVRN